jgi:prepilin-type N-terminal cleavage/methylation domain-containing protein
MTRRHAFTIIEMLAVLILLSALALVATKLFTATIRLTASSANARDTMISTEAALSVLRGDVWSARRIETPDARTAKLTLDDDRIVSWTISNDRLTRRLGDFERHWTTPPNASFACDEISLSLNDIRMTSQLRLLGRLVR